MSSERSLPVAVPSASAAAPLTKAQVYALADFWVSEHNRVPFRWSSDAYLAPPLHRREPMLLDFFPFNVEVDLGRLPKLATTSVLDLLFRSWAWLRRRLGQRQASQAFGVSGALESKLRRAFEESIADPAVRTLADKDQRAHLGEVLWSTLCNEVPPPAGATPR